MKDYHGFKTQEEYNAYMKEYNRKYRRHKKAEMKQMKNELEFLRGFKKQIDEDMERLGVKVPNEYRAVQT